MLDQAVTGTSSIAVAAIAPRAEVRHIVRRGETLSTIARNYGVTMTSIRAANSLHGSVIHPGDSLVIPAPGAGSAATLAALSFIVFLFSHLNLHYMNLVFAVLGYRVFTVYPPADGNPLTGKTRYAVITRRVSLSSGETIATYRLSDTVYLEAE
jgi:LysM repeat protein